MIQLQYPGYEEDNLDWEMYRLTYEGGQEFINNYLYKITQEETDEDLCLRKKLAYVPRFAGSVLDEIKNSIYQRITDVQRIGGSDNFRRAIKGEIGGIDYDDSSMHYFIGHKVLLELLMMKKVGVLIDNFSEDELGSTLYETKDKHPWASIYKIEQILNYKKSYNEYTNLLLCEFYEEENEYGLIKQYNTRYRLYTKKSDYVEVKFLDKDNKVTNQYQLNIPQIPFHCFEISRSLLKDVCRYQIALMNMESLDLTFIGKANYPLYYEHADPRINPPFADSSNSKSKDDDDTIRAGINKGRKIYSDKPPGFINPDPATLLASMGKGDKLKEEIRQLVHLNLAQANPRRQSVESKGEEQKPLEAGLSAIGLILHRGEQEISKFWAQFEKYTNFDVQINYPKNWSLKTDADRVDESEKLTKVAEKVPSSRFKKTILKKVANLLVGHEASQTELDKINREIDEADLLVTDPDILIRFHEQRVVPGEYVTQALHLPEGSAEKALEERISFAKTLVEAQGGQVGAARGTPELQTEQKTSKEEKK